MLYTVRAVTQGTGQVDTGLCQRESIVRNVVTCQELNVETEFFRVLCCSNVLEGWMGATRYAIELYIEVHHLGVLGCLTSEAPFMPVYDPGLDQSVPVLL